MLQNPQADNLSILCVFQQGTPLREYVIVQSVNSNRIAILHISESLFDFFVRASVPVCEPVTVPPGQLAGQLLLCVYRANLGTQEPIPFVVTQHEIDGQIAIIQITDEAYEFIRTIGVPVCLVINEN